LKKYKLSFVNKGREFELPDIRKVGFYKKLLEIQARIETKYKDMDKESNVYKNLVATETSIETAFFVLNKIDNNVTREDIENMTDEELADFITALYDLEGFENFRKAEKTASQQ